MRPGLEGRGFAMRERVVLHFNIADFAVAVERLNEPSLKTRPLIIAPLQAARAVVYDMSEEAYGEGVRKGMALRKAIRLCRKAEILSPREELYRKAMQAFCRELQGYSPLIESGRADGHFFVDLTGTHRLHGPAPDVGWKVRRNVSRSLGINPIWSLGTSKLVAKVASRLVKPVGEYIVAPGEEESFLAPLAIELLPGLQGGELERLLEFRLSTIGAVAALNLHQLRVAFGRRCDFFHAASRGSLDDGGVGGGPQKTAAIAFDHAFADDTNDFIEVQARVAGLAVQAGLALRSSQRLCRRVGVWLRYCDGAEIVRQASCPKGAAGDWRLQELAATALERAWLRRVRIHSCRLVCDRLQKESPQLSLFALEGKKSTRKERLQGAMDALRSRYGHETVGLARQFRRAKGAESFARRAN